MLGLAALLLGSGCGDGKVELHGDGDAGAAGRDAASDGGRALDGATAPDAGGGALDGAAPPDGGAADDGAVGASDGSPEADGGGTTDAAPGPDAGPAETGLRIDGRRVLRDGEPLRIHGVCWSPVAAGATLPPDFARFVTTDAPLMAAAGIDAVRTYEPIRDRGVLDRLQAEGIVVLQMVYAWGGADPASALEVVRELRDHPAIVMWVLGNEWNYNGLYVGLPFEESRARLQALAAEIHALDPTRPVATVYGELPDADTLAAMPDVDVWGLNVYRGLGFGDLFDRWRALSGKPMFVAEYGADAWDARTGEANPAAQAEAARVLTQALLDQNVADHPDGVVLGGTIFEWADEWWKDGAGSAAEHDVGGVAPGGGPHPDGVFNEEWWGVVEVDRTPRPAYDALRALYAP